MRRKTKRKRNHARLSIRFSSSDICRELRGSGKREEKTVWRGGEEEGERDRESGREEGERDGERERERERERSVGKVLKKDRGNFKKEDK
eukprot:1380470-Amorphochlora_amoeboformis.AAC.1